MVVGLEDDGGRYGILDAVVGKPAARDLGTRLADVTLRAASPNFSSEDVVMQVQQTLMSQAIKFRFTRMEYVYSLTGASRYSTINGDADADDDIGL